MADNGAKKASVEFFQYLINSSERSGIVKRFLPRIGDICVVFEG